MDPLFWAGRRVFVTGSTGFKGSWLTLWLTKLGAVVSGYALRPESRSLFLDAELEGDLETNFCDIRDGEALLRSLQRVKPEIVFHLAAQSLVLESYREPAETFDVNVMGTARVLDALRQIDSVRAAIIVTSDKCYEPQRIGPWAYREIDRLGGNDPYSASKACVELLVTAYKHAYPSQDIAIVTARAGNVIGGGDWAKERIVPDAMRALQNRSTLVIRHPEAVRPWQHILEPLRGYLELAEAAFVDPHRINVMNFGPGRTGERTVLSLLQYLKERSGGRLAWDVGPSPVAENAILRLDISLAAELLSWRPKLDITTALDLTYDWYNGEGSARARTLHDLAMYESTMQR